MAHLFSYVYTQGLRLGFISLVSLALPVAAQSLSPQRILEDFLREQTQNYPGQVSFTLSPFDARGSLAQCEALEPFIPQGTKLWGKATIGLRCLSPKPATVYVGVQVKVVSDYVVAARALNYGTTVRQEDLTLKRGDITTFPTSLLIQGEQVIGKTLKNSVGAGQIFRQDMLSAPWVVQQGQHVRTVSSGPGFSVSSEGKALNNATEGQVVQVKTPSGQIISGVARSNGVIEINR